MRMVKQAGDVAMKTQGFRNVIFDFQNVEFYKGLLDFLRTGNDGSETLSIIRVVWWESMKMVSQASDFTMKTQGFLNAISVSRMSSFTKDYLTFWEPEMTAQKPCQS